MVDAARTGPLMGDCLMTNEERQILAREVAADLHESVAIYGEPKDAFIAGWDAAMEYVKEHEYETRLEQSPGTR